MADKNKVIEVIYKAIDEVNNLLPADRRLDKRMDVVLSDKSRGGALDSMGMVNLVIALEQFIEEEFGKVILLASDLVISEENNPFETVDVLAENLSGILSGE